MNSFKKRLLTSAIMCAAVPAALVLVTGTVIYAKYRHWTDG